MKTAILLAGVLLLTSCDEPKDGSKPIDDSYIYIRDASGRCLKIETSFPIYSRYSSSLTVYVLPEKAVCAAEQKGLTK